MANRRASKTPKSFRRPVPYGAPKLWFTKAIAAVASLGLFSLAITSTYNFLVGDVTLSFVKPHGRYYDFDLRNDNSVDQLVKRFEVEYPPQKPIAHSTRTIVAKANDEGGYELPGGNSGWIPVTEFNELNGRILPANKVTPFIMPPTNSKSYLQLDAAVFDITFETEPANATLKAIDGILKALKLRNHVTKQRYLVMDNLWIPTRALSVAEAVRLACRDDDSLSDDLCPNHAGG
ncbi:hypothetical protein [Pseudomonas fluorescens]|uniref:hypothetical protein n=1 Tax=Pseudomonas fluorescens TaxID=294 RepID=UPI001259C7EC|nr:hypothetical protein [Pseudomonas fluorescens]VVO75800.1 hypothetical protein PS843_01517 [Pseudomonas fluorescens]